MTILVAYYKEGLFPEARICRYYEDVNSALQCLNLVPQSELDKEDYDRFCFEVKSLFGSGIIGNSQSPREIAESIYAQVGESCPRMISLENGIALVRAGQEIAKGLKSFSK